MLNQISTFIMSTPSLIGDDTNSYIEDNKLERTLVILARITLLEIVIIISENIIIVETITIILENIT